MNIKDEILNLILTNPKYFAAVYLLINNRETVEVAPEALQRRLERKSAKAKQSVAIADFFRSEGFQDSEIFEK